MSRIVSWTAGRAASGVPLLLALALLAGSAAAEVTVTDAGGREVTVTDTSRIISIGGDVTEILYDLGKQDQVVAVDTTSQFPPEALKEKEQVGYMRALSAEGVLSVNPSVIIASGGSGPPEVINLLKASSVPYVEVTDDSSPEAVAEKIRFVAKVVGAEDKGEELASKVEADFTALAEQREKIGKKLRVLFVLTVQDGRATVAGKGTGADSIITLAGAENAAATVTGYKPVVNEAAMELSPDAIVTMQHAGPMQNGLERIKSVQGLETTPAVKNGRVIQMDGLYLLGFGPRAAGAARDLMTKLYPELAQSKPDAAE